jgi:hypothetical protein
MILQVHTLLRLRNTHQHNRVAERFFRTEERVWTCLFHCTVRSFQATYDQDGGRSGIEKNCIASIIITTLSRYLYALSFTKFPRHYY